MTPFMIVQQLHSVAVTIMMLIMGSFIHAIENGSAP